MAFGHLKYGPSGHLRFGDGGHLRSGIEMTCTECVTADCNYTVTFSAACAMTNTIPDPDKSYTFTGAYTVRYIGDNANGCMWRWSSYDLGDGYSAYLCLFFSSDSEWRVQAGIHGPSGLNGPSGFTGNSYEKATDACDIANAYSWNRQLNAENGTTCGSGNVVVS